MSSIWWLTANLLKINLRKIGVIIPFFLIPVCGMLFSFLGYRPSAPGVVRVGVVDRDRSLVSRDLSQLLSRNSQIRIIPVKETRLNDDVASGRIDCAINIPAGFGVSMAKDTVQNIDLISVKGASVTAFVKNDILSWVQSLREITSVSGGDTEVFNHMYRQYRRNPVVVKSIRVRDEAIVRRITTQSIGFLIMAMMCGVGTACELILREKRERTFYRICGAPVSAWRYLLANVLANLVLVMGQIGLALLIMNRFFGMTAGIPVFPLFCLLVLFGGVAIGLGMAIVSFARDSYQATTMQTFIIQPTCMLGGCYWPSEMMPQGMRRIADFVPQTWELAAIRALQKGEGLAGIAIEVGIILAFAVALFMIAAYRFSRNKEVGTFI